MRKDIIIGKEEARASMNQLGAEKAPFFFAIDFECQQNIVLPLATVPAHGIEYSFDPSNFGQINGHPVQVEGVPLAADDYQKKFDQAVHYIKEGHSYLLNLTMQTPLHSTLDLQQIYRYSRAKYKLRVRDQFVVFSPEGFVQIEDEVISTTPMKGTIDASLPDARAIILQDPKERAEHVTVVDLLRNDLSMVASGVEVSRFQYVDTVHTNRGSLLQVSSEIKGQLPSGYQRNMGDILFTLLPAGSVSGAPKRRTLEIIREIEGSSRGFYTGVFGVFTGEKLQSAVMIRFIENIGGELYYRSGGGITSLSQMESEYREMIDKVYVPIY